MPHDGKRYDCYGDDNHHVHGSGSDPCHGCIVFVELVFFQ